MWVWRLQSEVGIIDRSWTTIEFRLGSPFCCTCCTFLGKNRVGEYVLSLTRVTKRCINIFVYIRTVCTSPESRSHKKRAPSKLLPARIFPSVLKSIAKTPCLISDNCWYGCALPVLMPCSTFQRYVLPSEWLLARVLLIHA